MSALRINGANFKLVEVCLESSDSDGTFTALSSVSPISFGLPMEKLDNAKLASNDFQLRQMKLEM